MKDQILKIIEAEGLTPAKFADEIGVQRSSISHIISGRNKPSYDFIIKIIQRYRGINAEWLLTGKGPMIKSSDNLNSAKKTLFDDENDTIKTDAKDKSVDVKKNENELIKVDNTNKSNSFQLENTDKNTSDDLKFTNVNNDNFILVFYKDGTYRKFIRRE